jgi:hypothetical protein
MPRLTRTFASESGRPLMRAKIQELPKTDSELLTKNCAAVGPSQIPTMASRRKKINISGVLVGQTLGINEVDDGIWLVSFKHYDLGYIDLEQKTLQLLENLFSPT